PPTPARPHGGTTGPRLRVLPSPPAGGVARRRPSQPLLRDVDDPEHEANDPTPRLPPRPQLVSAQCPLTRPSLTREPLRSPLRYLLVPRHSSSFAESRPISAHRSTHSRRSSMLSPSSSDRKSSSSDASSSFIDCTRYSP